MMTTKLAYRVTNFREAEPQPANDMYAAPPGWQVASRVPPALGRIAQEILSRAVDERWPMPSQIYLKFEGKPYIARYQIHGKNQFNPKNHPGVGLYERIADVEEQPQQSRHLGDKLDNNFFVNLKAMCNRLGCNPEDMLAIMNLESGLDPAAANPKYPARGLTQIEPFHYKNLDFHGTNRDFARLSAVEQLPYIERYFENVMNTYHTGPLRSRTELYIANFWPAALSNRAVQSQDPNAVIVDSAKNPKEYTANKGLDVDKDGKITYGDLERITGYKQREVAHSDVLARMEQATGAPTEEAPSQLSSSNIGDFLAKIENMLDRFMSSASRKEQMTKIAITPEKFLILVQADDLPSRLEYAAVLKTALKEELNAYADIHTDGENVELECVLLANKEKVFEAIKELCDTVSDTFEYATRKIGGIKTQAILMEDYKSDYQELDINVAEVNHRKFMLKFAKAGI
jgi:hypothetical protein